MNNNREASTRLFAALSSRRERGASIIDGEGFAAALNNEPFAPVEFLLGNRGWIVDTLQDDFGVEYPPESIPDRSLGRGDDGHIHA